MSFHLAGIRRELGPMTRLATPVVVAEVGWVTMGLVDIAMVGRLGPAAIGAVGIGSILFIAVVVFGIGTAGGAAFVVHGRLSRVRKDGVKVAGSIALACEGA